MTDCMTAWLRDARYGRWSLEIHKRPRLDALDPDGDHIECLIQMDVAV